MSILKYKNVSKKDSLITHCTGGDRSQFHTTLEIPLLKNATIGECLMKVNSYFALLMLPLPPLLKNKYETGKCLNSNAHTSITAWIWWWPFFLNLLKSFLIFSIWNRIKWKALQERTPWTSSHIFPKLRGICGELAWCENTGSNWHLWIYLGRHGAINHRVVTGMLCNLLPACCCLGPRRKHMLACLLF